MNHDSEGASRKSADKSLQWSDFLQDALREAREPIEVYFAAIGHPEHLAQRIEGGEYLGRLERNALAAFLKGELKPPKRKRGQRRLSYLRGTMEDIQEVIMQEAVLDYHHIMSEVLKKTGTKHKMKSAVAGYIADRDRLDVEKLLFLIDHPDRIFSSKSPDDLPPPAVRRFHEWLFRTNRLEGYPKYLGPNSHDQLEVNKNVKSVKSDPAK